MTPTTPHAPPLPRRKLTGARPGRPPEIRVLIVDDNAFVRRALAAMIDAEPDMACCGAFPATGVTVDELVRCRAGLVLIDVSVRRGPGLELVQELRRRRPAIRIVALAIDEKPGDVARVFDAGAEACLRKLELAPRVLRAIRRTHRKQNSTGPDRTAGSGRVTAAGPLRLVGTEAEVAELIGRGAPGRAIAIELGLSLTAVEACRRRLRERLHMPSGSRLVEYCVQWVREQRDDRAHSGL